MKKKLLIFAVCSIMALFITACSDSEAEPTAENTPPATASSSVEPGEEQKAPAEKKEDYTEIIELFEEVCKEKEISAKNPSGNYVQVTILTDFTQEAEPDGWENTIAALDKALSSANDFSPQYNVQTVAAQIVTEDGAILASGMNGSVKHNLFREKEDIEQQNPPTITKFEYDSIAIGMTLEQVREIIGSSGELQNEIGGAGGITFIRTYRWYGEKEGSYADILFDNYKVYDKIEIFLE